MTWKIMTLIKAFPRVKRDLWFGKVIVSLLKTKHYNVKCFDFIWFFEMLICILRNKEGRVSYTHTQIHILQHDWALAVFEQSIWIRGAKERGEKTRVNQNVVKWRKQKNTKHQNKTQNRYWQNDLSFRKKFFECILRLRTGSIVSPTRERVQSRGLCIEVKAYIAVHCDLNHIHRFVCVRLVGQHIFCLYIFAWKKVFSPNIFYFFFHSIRFLETRMQLSFMIC